MGCRPISFVMVLHPQDVDLVSTFVDTVDPLVLTIDAARICASQFADLAFVYQAIEIGAGFGGGDDVHE